MVKIGDTIEIEGRTTQEAITLALNRLAVTKDRVKIKILSEGQQGLFGMKGAKQAKVKVIVVK